MKQSNQFRKRISSALGVVAAAIISTAANAGNPVISITDLGTLGGSQSQATAINSSGQVVGNFIASDGYTYAFLYSGGTMQSIGVMPGSTKSNATILTAAVGINDSGQIAGNWCCDAGGDGDLFLYSNGSYQNLNLEAGGSSYIGVVSATAVNNAGVVALDYIPGSAPVGELYSGGVLTGATGPGTAVLNTITAINSRGDYVGAYCSSTLENVFCTYGVTANLPYLQTASGTTQLIPGLGGQLESTTTILSTALGVNNHDQVVGFALLPNGNFHAFFYSNNTTLDMGALGGLNSSAMGINDNGFAVGWADTLSGAQHAALFLNGHAIDLSTLPAVTDAGWTVLSVASAINSKNQIVGWGTIGGQTHAFLISGISFNF